MLGAEGPPVPSKLAVLTGFYFMLPPCSGLSRILLALPLFSVSLFREFCGLELDLLLTSRASDVILSSAGLKSCLSVEN